MVHSEHPNKCHNYKRSMWQTSISLCVSCNFSARDLFNFFQVLNTVHTKSKNKTGWTWYIHVYSNRFPGTFLNLKIGKDPKQRKIISTKALISFFRMYFAMKKTTSILAQKKTQNLCSKPARIKSGNLLFHLCSGNSDFGYLYFKLASNDSKKERKPQLFLSGTCNSMLDKATLQGSFCC